MDARRSDRLYAYDIWVTDALPVGSPVRETRQGLAEIGDLSAAELRELAELDGILIQFVRADDVLREILEDDPAQPLERWWWHLGALRAGTYPEGLLPEPLRSVYRESPPAARPAA